MRAPRDLRRGIGRRVRRLTARTRYRLGLSEPPPQGVSLAATFHHPMDADGARTLAERYQALFPEAAANELAEAQRLMRHEFTLLGHRVIHGDRIAWCRDPVSRRDWSRGFAEDIPYRGPDRLGDIKLPWELNKHQHFFTLGKSAWLANDAAYATEIVRQIDHWIDDNPCLRGINWISALESGTRAISWVMAYPFYASCCDDAFRRRLARSMAQHMRFVETHLSTGAFANTHLVGEATALVVGGLFLASRRSATWLKKGLAILNEEIDRQVTADGMHVERSVAYHRFFLDHYYLVTILLAANGGELPPATRRQIEKMTEFLMNLIHPDGSVPAFGDCDDARGLWLHARCADDHRSLLALGAALFGRSDFKGVAGDLAEDVLWLLGNDGVSKFQALRASVPAYTSRAFADAGYYVMRGGWGRGDPVLAFDCGPLGHGPAGHGHADALSFQLYAAGYPFLVDAGTYSYNLDYEWRNAFRSTIAHNTLVVDGESQSVPGDRMGWKSMARVHSRRWVSTQWFDVVDGEHDGYRRLADPVTHRRVIVFIKPGTWLIWDRLDGAGHHRFDALLHAMPACSMRVGEDAGDLLLEAPTGATLRARMFVDGEAASPDLITGTAGDRTAWFSPRYGSRLPARASRISRAFSGHATLVTHIAESAGTTTAVLDHDESIRIAARRDSRNEDLFFYRIHRDWPAGTDGIHFDGQLLYRRESCTGPDTVWAAGFRELSVGERLHVRSMIAVESLVLHDDRCEVTLPARHASALRITTVEGIRVVVNGHPAPRSTVLATGTCCR